MAVYRPDRAGRLRENLYAVDIEDAIKCDPLVKDAVICGQRRARLFLLLDFAACGGEEFWPHWSGCGRRWWFFAGKGRPFLPLVKGSVDRSGSMRRRLKGCMLSLKEGV
jgi:hypothetical protein